MANFENLSAVLMNTDPHLGISEDLYSYTVRVIFAVIFLLFCISGTVGNSSVIIAVLLSRKLQTPTNAFVVSLAITDLITSVFTPFHAASLLSPNGWPLPDAKWLCTIAGFQTYNCVLGSLLSLAAISVNRYILITKPFKTYQKIYTPVNIGIMVAATWLLPSSLYLSLKSIFNFGYNKKFFLCIENPLPQNEFAVILLEVVIILLVLSIILTSYILVFRYVRQHYNKNPFKKGCFGP